MKQFSEGIHKITINGEVKNPEYIQLKREISYPILLNLLVDILI